MERLTDVKQPASSTIETSGRSMHDPTPPTMSSSLYDAAEAHASLQQSSTEPVYDREQYYEASRDVMAKLQNYYKHSTIEEEEDDALSSDDEIDPEFVAYLPKNDTEQADSPDRKNPHHELLRGFKPLQPAPGDSPEQEPSKLPEEEPSDVDYRFMIVDGSTGQTVDPSSFKGGVAKTTAKVAMPKAKPAPDPWKKWWRRKAEVNRKFARAAERGQIDVMKDLLDPKKQSKDLVADLNFQGHENWTPLHYSAIEGALESVEFLLSKGANVNAQTSLDRTALHIACTRGHSDIAERLLKDGVELNTQDKEQNTAMHLCAMYNQLECVELLLSHDARLELRNSQSNTPLDVASSIEVAEMLQNYIERKTSSADVVGQYSRMKMGSVIRRTNRSDFVQRMLDKASSLGKQGLIQRREVAGEQPEEKKLQVK